MHDVQQSSSFTASNITASSFTTSGTAPVIDANLNSQLDSQLDSQPDSKADRISTLTARLATESLKNQMQTVAELAEAGDEGWDALISLMIGRSQERQSSNTMPTPLDGKIYQQLVRVAVPKTHEFLKTQFPRGLVPLRSEKGLDYTQLQDLLIGQAYEDADRLTLEKFCELAGELATKRKWVYFTDVEQFPITDLQTIDALWFVYSEGKFGFSVQRDLWASLGQNWGRLWEKIGWKSGNTWTRYPGEFIWDTSAPKGHMPLSNQLRGVRVMAALMAHPAWKK
jgi:GUN4-like/ARM-like repeat domain, GUN4-N terminal